MKKILVTAFVLITFSSTLIANEDMAIASFKKNCKSCHGSAFYVAGTLLESDWNELFKDNGKKLFESHKHLPKAVKILSSNYYMNRIEDLKIFLSSHGKDTGSIPPCNSTTCGFDVKLLQKYKR